VILLFALSATPAAVPLISSPITDVDARLQIAAKLDEMQVKYQLRGDNEFYVADEQVARRVRMVLNQENLIPKGTDPWALFDTQSWTTTDFERDVNLQRAVTRQLEQHILALDDIDNASVVLQIPRTELFAADQSGGFEQKFGNLLLGALGSVNDSQLTAMNLSQKMVTDPQSVNVEDVTIALADANLALSMTKAIVDRALAAYREIINIR
jgi:flagellar hook-basal body complex protein FliE